MLLAHYESGRARCWSTTARPNPRQRRDPCRRLRPLYASHFPVPHDYAPARHRRRALCGSRARRHRRCGCRAMSDIIDMKAQRKKRRPSVEAEQALRRALARGSALRCLSLKHEVALFIWRAAAVADSDPDKGADFLEMARSACAERRWRNPHPHRLGISRQSGEGSVAASPHA
jgi:hypothetical protein